MVMIKTLKISFFLLKKYIHVCSVISFSATAGTVKIHFDYRVFLLLFHLISHPGVYNVCFESIFESQQNFYSQLMFALEESISA
jgi:hypothetical protein